jgi:hypothetical protein
MTQLCLSLINAYFRSEWVGNRPSLSALAIVLKRRKLIVHPGSRLAVLGPEEIQTAMQGQVDQLEITAPDDHDRELVKSSILGPLSREVARIVVRTEQGEIIRSDLMTGALDRVGDLEAFRRRIRHLVFDARKRGLNVTEIEIVHTHPGFELLIVDDSGGRLVLSGLSKADRLVGARLAEFLDYPLRIKAITLGASYSALF